MALMTSISRVRVRTSISETRETYCLKFQFPGSAGGQTPLSLSCKMLGRKYHPKSWSPACYLTENLEGQDLAAHQFLFVSDIERVTEHVKLDS